MENKRIYGLVNINVPARNVATAVGVALLGAACGQTEVSQSRPIPEQVVQGEPIQGEPIVAAVVEEELPVSPNVPKTVAEPTEVTESVPMVPLEPAKRVETAVAEASQGQVGDSEVAVLDETINEVTAAATSLVAEAAEVATLEVLALPPESEEATKDAQSEPERLADGSLDISFDRLASFEYEMPEDLTEEVAGETDGASDQIPEDIRELNDQPIALKGFMLPLKVEEGLVTEMLIMRDQSMCCYGTVPKINEWVSVRMEGKGVKPVMDQAVTLFGKLKVGEIRENGYLVGIYEMDGDRMDGPSDL